MPKYTLVYNLEIKYEVNTQSDYLNWCYNLIKWLSLVQESFLVVTAKKAFTLQVKF